VLHAAGSFVLLAGALRALDGGSSSKAARRCHGGTDSGVKDNARTPATHPAERLLSTSVLRSRHGNDRPDGVD
jgi:hypothetical protein